jgi:signal transduction histidine kinase
MSRGILGNPLIGNILNKSSHPLSTTSKRYRNNLGEAALAGGMGFSSSIRRITKPALQGLQNFCQRGPSDRSEEEKILTELKRQLRCEIQRRKAAERRLEVRHKQFNHLLEDSRRMQSELQHLSHKILQAQEEERKHLSRELHDEIAQTLTVISLELANLQSTAVRDKTLCQKIKDTQILLQNSAQLVHRFARDLRPPLLDDIGLIPAVQSFVKNFSQRMRVSVRFNACPEVEQVSHNKRIVLYRVMQAALTNVGVHAEAKKAEVNIKKMPHAISMEIRDNGKSFCVDQVLDSKRNHRLGLVGMRERIEMVGGQFRVVSRPNYGTAIWCQIPLEDSVS